MKFKIYKIENTINNKVYIGLTKRSIENRFWYHKRDAIKNSTHILHNAIRKHGEENFIISLIVETDTLENARILEKYYILQYNSFFRNERGYNMTLGGEGMWGHKHSDKSKEKMRSIRIKYYKNPEHLKELCNLNKGRLRSESAKQKTSESLKEYYKNNKHHQVGIPLSEEHKQNISAANKGRKPSKNTIDACKQKESSWWLVTYPDGTKKEVFNLHQFCRDNKLSVQNLHKTSKDLIKKSQGYSCVKINKLC